MPMIPMQLYIKMSGAPETLDRSDAIEIHEALAPWEKKGGSFLPFLLVLGSSAIGGLVLGSMIDNLVQVTTANDPNAPTANRARCAGGFFLQIFLNMLALFILSRIVPWVPFVPWLLMTLAGFLFTVLLFQPQDSLTVNSVCLLKL